MNMTKTCWLFCGLAVFYALFFVFCCSSIVEAKLYTRMTQAELHAYKDGMAMSLASENLARAPESLRLGLRVESRGLPTEEMTKTKAWSELQETVSKYARRLEFVDEQNRLWKQQCMKRGLWMSRLSTAAIIAALLLTLLYRRSMGREARRKRETRQSGTEPT